DGTVDDAAAVLHALGEVREVSIDGRRLRSRVADGARAVPPILAALDSRGIAVESVTMHRPSLDDVYLHYTGRDFRAEDEAGGEGCIPRSFTRGSWSGASSGNCGTSRYGSCI